MTNIKLFTEYEKDNDVKFSQGLRNEIIFCSGKSCGYCSLFELNCTRTGKTPALTPNEFEELKSMFPEYFI